MEWVSKMDCNGPENHNSKLVEYMYLKDQCIERYLIFSHTMTDMTQLFCMVKEKTERYLSNT